MAFAVQSRVHITLCGSLLSPSDIGQTDEFLIDMKRFNKILHIDTDKKFVQMQSGVILSDLIKALKSFSLGLPTLGSITSQTIGGLLGTCVHGTGKNHGSFCSLVDSMRVMTTEGNVLSLSSRKNHELFQAALVGLGCMGIIIDITFRVEKINQVESVQMPISTEFLIKNIQDLSKSAEYFRAWIIPHVGKSVIWSAKKIDSSEASNVEREIRPQLIAILGKILKLEKVCELVKFHSFQISLLLAKLWPHWLPSVNQLYYQANLSQKIDKRGCYEDLFTFNCLFEQYVNEWTVSVDGLGEFLRELLRKIREKKFFVHLPIEVRFSAKESAWLSPSYDREVAWVGIIMYKPYGFETCYEEYFCLFEELMVRFKGRPHWAKEFRVRRDYLKTVYPRLKDWEKSREVFDPKKLINNRWVEKIFYNE